MASGYCKLCIVHAVTLVEKKTNFTVNSHIITIIYVNSEEEGILCRKEELECEENVAMYINLKKSYKK